MVLEIAISRRRSRAVGCRRAMIVDRSRSIEDLHLVDQLFLLEHLRRGLAEVDQRIDRLRDLRLGQAAHFQHAGRDAAQSSESNWVERCLSSCHPRVAFSRTPVM